MLWKVTTVMHMLAYGCASDSLDDTLRLEESTALLCIYRFSVAVVDAFRGEFSRAPIDEDTKVLLERA